MKFSVSVLDNGLTVMTDEIPEAKASTVKWSLRAGSRRDSCAGAGHFFEHLLAVSLSSREGDEVIKRFRQISTDFNFVTSKECISAYACVLPQFVPEVIGTIGSTVTAPKWTDAIFNREKKRILSEAEESKGNVKYSLFQEAFRLAYQGHPIAQSILGPPENIQAMTEEHCHNFHGNFFLPNLMGLTVSGPVPHEQALDLADKAFGRLCPRELALQAKPDFKAYQSSALVFQVPMQTLTVAFEGPSAQTFEDSAAGDMRTMLWYGLNDCFNEMGAYSTPACEGKGMSDCGQHHIRFEIHPDRVEEALKSVRSVLLNPESWMNVRAFEDLRIFNATTVAFKFLNPEERAGRIDYRFQTTGQVRSYENMVAEDERVTLADCWEAYHAMDLKRFNIVGYGPRNDLPERFEI